MTANRQNLLGRFLCDTFGHIYIINLRDRGDRRREMEQQLRRVGLSLAAPEVTLFEAIRPDTSGAWPTIGARGCFMSHLGVLRTALGRGQSRILVLEDDINWSRTFLKDGPAQFDALATTDWDFVHGGLTNLPDSESGILPLEPGRDLTAASFIGLRGDVIARSEAVLSVMTGREAGDSRGGPMHVDGAYCWIRRDNPDIRAFVLNPAIAYQRASKTDIHAHSWKDRTPGISWAMRQMRRLRNAARDRID